MPALIPIAAAIAGAAATASIGAALATGLGLVTAAGALSLGGTLVASLVGAVVATAVGYGLSAVFGTDRKPPSVGARAQDRKQTIRSSVAPRQVVYGTARVSGPIVYASSSGSAKQFLHLVVPVAGHKVAGPLALWINDERIPVANFDGTTGLVTTGTYANRVRFRFFTGAQTAASSELVAETTDGWSADHVLRDTAYVYLRLEFDRDVFSNGPGALSVEIQGHNGILDPRTNATGFSNNPALCILHYLTSADGLACTADEIDLASFIAAANVCDENVQIAAGGATQKRYTLDGAFTLDQAPIAILEDMLTSCAGTLVYVQGQYRLYAGAYGAPSDTLTASDVAGQIEMVTRPPRRELFNTVRGTFINPARNWQASEFPAYAETAITAADGEVIEKDVEWPFTTDEIRAQRLAKLTLRRAREALTVRVPVKYAGIRYAVWQTLNVTLADFGWTNKPFRIVAWTFDAGSGIISLTLREESANSYAWQFGDAQPLPLAPDTDLVDPLAIPAPASVATTASTVLQADGSVAPALLVTWTASAFAFLIAHEVQWRVTGAADWNSAEVPAGTNRYVIAPVIVGTSYDVRVRAVTGIARGAWSSTATGVGAADTTAPDAPTGLTATGIPRGISVAWTLPTATDLAAVEVWENNTSSTTGRTFAGETRATGFVRTGLSPNVTRWFWVRSRDLSGNVSAYAGPVSATSSLLLADDIQDGILNTAKFASSIAPVGLVTSVPATKGSNPDVIFNQTDGKLYRWNGSAFTASVAAGDLSGEITATQISDGAISAPKIAANAITAGKIAAAAISTTELAAGAVTAVKLASSELITSSAQLGTAVVTTAKIGDLQVNTIKVADGSISATSAATWWGSITSATYSQRATISVGDSIFAGNFLVLVEGRGGGSYAYLDADGNTAYATLGFWVRVRRNGETIIDEYSTPGSLTMCRVDNPGVGIHAYYVDLKSDGITGSNGATALAELRHATIAVTMLKK